MMMTHHNNNLLQQASTPPPTPSTKQPHLISSHFFHHYLSHPILHILLSSPTDHRTHNHCIKYLMWKMRGMFSCKQAITPYLFMVFPTSLPAFPPSIFHFFFSRPCTCQSKTMTETRYTHLWKVIIASFSRKKITGKCTDFFGRVWLNKLQDYDEVDDF